MAGAAACRGAVAGIGMHNPYGIQSRLVVTEEAGEHSLGSLGGQQCACVRVMQGRLYVWWVFPCSGLNVAMVVVVVDGALGCGACVAERVVDGMSCGRARHRNARCGRLGQAAPNQGPWSNRRCCCVLLVGSRGEVMAVRGRQPGSASFCCRRNSADASYTLSCFSIGTK